MRSAANRAAEAERAQRVDQAGQPVLLFAQEVVSLEVFRRRHEPEAPCPFAGRDLIGVDETARAFVAPRRSRKHQVAHDQRRRCGAVMLPVIGHFGVPQKLTVQPVESDDVRVIGNHEHFVAQNC